MKRRWKKVSGKTVFENQRISIAEDTVLQPNGKATDYTVVQRSDAVFIVAVTEEGKLVLVEQHRYPIDKMSLEIPAGMLPPGVDPAEQAARELKEETGAVAKVESMGIFHVMPSRVRGVDYAYLARGISENELHHEGQEDDETINRVLALTPAEVRSMISEGRIIDGDTLAVLNIYWSKYPEARP